MTSTCFGLLGCLFLSLVANVNGQVTIEVAACGDLPSSVSEDTIITFTAIEVRPGAEAHDSSGVYTDN